MAFIYPSFGKGKGKGKGKANNKGLADLLAQQLWGQQEGQWAWVPDGGAKYAGGKSKGKGKQASGGTKRKAPSSGGPLDQMKVAMIIALLEENGGSMSLGKLSTVVEGLKKAQLEGIFAVDGDPASGNFTVSFLDGIPPSLDGFVEVAAPQNSFKTPNAKKQKKQKTDANAEPPPSLEHSQVEEINLLLQMSGGSVSLGKLTTIVPGLKKAQVEEHFTVEGAPESGNFTVSLGPPGQVQKKVKKPSLLPDGSDSFVAKKKKQRERRDPDAPVEPLDDSVVQQIGNWLLELGGSSSLGKLTTAFSGVKKAQLEAHFAVSVVPDRRSGDPTVSLQ